MHDDVDISALRRRRTVKWRAVESDVLAAWVAEMDYAVADPIREAILDAVAREDFGYPDDDAGTGLPEAFTAYAARTWDWHVDPSRVGLVPDVVRGIELALEVFAPHGSGVIVPVPAYPPFFDVVARSKRPVVPVPLTTAEVPGDRPILDMDAIARALAEGARTVILCNPYNPVGRVFTRPELLELAGIVDFYGARVIADEIHAPLVMPGETHIPYASIHPSAAAHSVTVTSASKAWNLAGLKCAQVVLGDAGTAATWWSLPDIARHGATTLGIAAQIAAYDHGGPWLAETVAYLDGNRRALAAALDRHPRLNHRTPEGTYLAWIDCRALGLADPAAFFLEKARVALYDGRRFGDVGEGFVRLNLATSRPILDEMTARMTAALQG
ncbi:MalY/PatB family protein [Yinghuangia seranimata]|uniref:MalY/PatB family protein n=1 Tax=Yinghuangia seranimata TaxID=408067 RepID=UPI00248AB0FE|nr:aminotransferase class I/II-fold pyridoxal phosphate-dependent enzyme [Yinghuangia seranimata]MDI2128858.1 aminotransferase class I/II-fold pyridoxal phosphate-dependent enzyme [Yinghuangia seranimata]